MGSEPRSKMVILDSEKGILLSFLNLGGGKVRNFHEVTRMQLNDVSWQALVVLGVCS